MSCLGARYTPSVEYRSDYRRRYFMSQLLGYIKLMQAIYSCAYSLNGGYAERREAFCITIPYLINQENIR